MSKLTHFNEAGEAVMVDISAKADTERIAVAVGTIHMNRECFDLVRAGRMGKGDVLGAARIAGIMGAKKTSELIPLCHIISLSRVEIDFELLECAIRVRCTAKCIGKTGVEMEALTGVNVALLTIYDMCKAADKKMTMADIHLVSKAGGKNGDFIY